jgi:hypothetical protein
MEITIMTPDTFFVSKGLEDLFTVGPTRTIAQVRLNGFEGKFISFNQRNRMCRFEVDVVNPFDVVKGENLDVQIIFDEGQGRLIQYKKFLYKIEHSHRGFIIVVEDVINE